MNGSLKGIADTGRVSRPTVEDEDEGTQENIFLFVPNLIGKGS